MSITNETIATAFKSAISGSTFKLDITPLQIDLSDKFKMTQVYTTWLKHFDRLLAAHPNRSDTDKEKILLINVGQTGAAFFDRASTVTTEANEYLNARKTLENIFCVPNASAEARVIFFGTRPKPNEKTLAYLGRLRKAAVLCEFANTDAEIMRVLMSTNSEPKWQEKRFSAKWTEESLAAAEQYARQLEQTDLLKKELKETYSSSSGSVNRITNTKNCDYCGRVHKKGQCPAYNKQCDHCKKMHHFSSVCKSRNSTRGTNGQSRGGFRGRGRGQFNSYRGRGGAQRGGGTSRGGGGAYRGANGNNQSIRKIQQDSQQTEAASENNSDSFESSLRNLSFNE
jgi:uncharacterized membrane protein YgcG